MKLRLPLLLAAAVLAACSSFCVTANAANNTILTFAQNDEVNKDLNSHYGSYASSSKDKTAPGNPGYIVNGTGTPNIGLTYTGTWQTYQDDVWLGGVGQIESEDSILIFTPNAGSVGISLGSISLQGYYKDEGFEFTITVTGSLDSGNPLYEQTFNWSVNSGSSLGPIVDLSSIQGKSGETLTLTLHRVSGSGSSIAVDDITFSQIGDQVTEIILKNGDSYDLAQVVEDAVSLPFILDTGADGSATLRLDSGTKTLTGTLSGTGNLKKTGDGKIVLTNYSGTYGDGDIDIEAGSIQLNSGNNSTAFGGAGTKGTIYIRENTTLAFGNGGNYSINKDISLQNQEKIYLEDPSGTNNLNGPLTVTGKGTIEFLNNKTLVLNGALSGADESSILDVLANEKTGWGGVRLLTLKGSGENFNGQINIISAEDGNGVIGTESDHRMVLNLANEKAAVNAKINLQGTKYNSAYLRLSTSATIAGLNSDNVYAVVESADATARTLTITGAGAYSGSFAANVNIKKTGADTLILTGDSANFNGNLDVEEGILQFGDSVSMGAVGGNKKLTIGEKGTVVYQTAKNVDASIKMELWGMGTIRHIGDGTVSLMHWGSHFTGKYELSPTGTLQFDAAANSDLTFAGALSGNENIVKIGAGTTILTNFTGDYANGDVTIKEGILRINAPTNSVLFGGQGTTGSIIIQDNSYMELAPDRKDQYYIYKNLSLVNGGTLLTIDAANTDINGKLFISGTGNLEYSNNKTICVNGPLEGDENSILNIIANERTQWGGSRLLVLSGSGENFKGEIGVYSAKRGSDYIVTLNLNHAQAASNATINLQGNDKCFSHLGIGIDKTSIKNLKGNQYSLVKSMNNTVRSLNITGKGTFAGTFENNLNLEKSGTDTLLLTGTSNNFNGTVTVSGGKLQLGDGTTAGKFADTTIISVTGGELALGAGNKLTNQVNISKGTLTLDQDQTSVGNVDISGTGILNMNHTGTAAGNVSISGTGTFNLKQTAASIGAVSLNGGSMNLTAAGTMASLTIGGNGQVTVATDILTVNNQQIVLNDSGSIRFTETGQLAQGTSIQSNNASATIEIAKNTDNDFTADLSGNATLRINNTNATTTYKGNAATFEGIIDITKGSLALDTDLAKVTVQISSGAKLIFNGTEQQVKTVTGTTGSVSFTNTAANITSNTLLGNYGGTLLMGTGQKVTFEKRDPLMTGL